jgi:alkyl hydroperoxide reductase subunit AhpC
MSGKGGAGKSSVTSMLAVGLSRSGNRCRYLASWWYVDGNVKRVRLSDLKGKWILLCFYPGDFTYVCATEVAGVIEGYRRLEDLGVKAVAVSEDSLHSHKVWVETSPAITDALQKTNLEPPHG